MQKILFTIFIIFKIFFLTSCTKNLQNLKNPNELANDEKKENSSIEKSNQPNFDLYDIADKPIFSITRTHRKNSNENYQISIFSNQVILFQEGKLEKKQISKKLNNVDFEQIKLLIKEIKKKIGPIHQTAMKK